MLKYPSRLILSVDYSTFKGKRRNFLPSSLKGGCLWFKVQECRWTEALGQRDAADLINITNISPRFQCTDSFAQGVSVSTTACGAWRSHRTLFGMWQTWGRLWAPLGPKLWKIVTYMYAFIQSDYSTGYTLFISMCHFNQTGSK